MFLVSKHKTVPGGALYYVIFVVFILSAIVSLFLLHRGVRLKQVHQEIEYFTRIDDLNSALTLYLSQPEHYQRAPVASIFLFDDTSRTVQIAKEPHGLLNLITASNDYRGKLLSKTLLVGKDPFEGDSIALYVPDNRQALYASGNTIINGNAVIPAKGLQRASIEGRPLRRANPVEGRISKSGSSLPKLAPSIIKKIHAVQDFDSLSNISVSINELFQSSIENAYTEETKWFSSDSDFQISGIQADGRIGFLSSGTILLKKDASLNGVIVSASKIIVEEGFEGDVQLFARDSLVIGMNCRLAFPSVVCLNNDNVNNIYMEIGESSTIDGTVLVTQENLSTKKPFLSLKEGAIIKGQVYHQGTVELLGKIHGSLYCEGFYMKTKRAYYENHLLDNEIDVYRLPYLFVSIDLIQGYNDQVIDIVGNTL